MPTLFVASSLRLDEVSLLYRSKKMKNLVLCSNAVCVVRAGVREVKGKGRNMAL